jgi:glycosyltransferase involved in cell wall biosynthesis
MRILQVTHYMPPHMGGIEIVASSLFEGLSSRGHEVRWMASAVPSVPHANDGGRIRVRAWNALERRVGVPYPLWSPDAFARLSTEVRRADVVHVHDCLYMGSAAAAAACKILRRPLLVTQHIGHVPYGPMLDFVEHAAYRTLGRAVLGAADRLVACSPHVPDWFRALGVKAAFDLVPNGIEDEHFRPASDAERTRVRAELDLGPEDKVVLFAGRLVPKKGTALVAEVHRRLASEGVTLLVAGEGPDADRFPASARKLGRVDRSRMASLYRAADVLLLPSRGEGLPLTVQEAMLSGLPVVVSRDEAFTGNLRGAPGVAFEDDEALLADAARRALSLASQPDAARERSVVAAWARARWSKGTFLDRYEAILAELTGARAA